MSKSKLNKKGSSKESENDDFQMQEVVLMGDGTNFKENPYEDKKNRNKESE